MKECIEFKDIKKAVSVLKKYQVQPLLGKDGKAYYSAYVSIEYFYAWRFWRYKDKDLAFLLGLVYDGFYYGRKEK